jgi:hypothetical protein
MSSNSLGVPSSWSKNEDSNNLFLGEIFRAVTPLLVVPLRVSKNWKSFLVWYKSYVRRIEQRQQREGSNNIHPINNKGGTGHDRQPASKEQPHQGSSFGFGAAIDTDLEVPLVLHLPVYGATDRLVASVAIVHQILLTFFRTLLLVRRLCDVQTL